MAANTPTTSTTTTRRPALLLGGGVGALSAVPALDVVNRLSSTTQLTVTVLSPQLGAAAGVALALHRNGVAATAIEGRLDAQPPEFLSTFATVIVCDGRADTIGTVLPAIRGTTIGFLGYLHIAYADHTIQSFAFSTTGTDDQDVVNITLLVRQIHQLTAPTRNGVFGGASGVGAGPSQLCHKHHEHHLRHELPAHLARIERDAFPVMTSMNGAPPRPAIILHQPLGPPSPQIAAEEAARIDSRVLDADQYYYVLEIIPNGIRMHEIFVPAAGQGLAVRETRTVIHGDVKGHLYVQD